MLYFTGAKVNTSERCTNTPGRRPAKCRHFFSFLFDEVETNHAKIRCVLKSLKGEGGVLRINKANHGKAY